MHCECSGIAFEVGDGIGGVIMWVAFAGGSFFAISVFGGLGLHGNELLVTSIGFGVLCVFALK